MKCGEERPSCVKCTSTGRKCEYQESPRSSPVGIPSPENPPGSLPGTVWRERRAFAYYFENVAPCIGGGLDADFWRTIVPQVCGSEPAVWDAIISVSALYENPDPYPKLGILRQGTFHALGQPHQDALNWYSRSVSAIRQRLERGGIDVFVGLVTCMLFICIECLQAGTDEAQQLYRQGCDLIASLQAQIARGLVPAPQVILLERIVIPVFVRLGTIGVAVSPPPIDAFSHHASYATTQSFTSLKESRDAMILLSLEAQTLEQKYGQFVLQSPAFALPGEFYERQSILSARLKRWNTAFAELMETLNQGELSQHEIALAAIIMAYHETVVVILAVCNSPSHTSIDAYLPHFHNIIENCTTGLNASIRPDGSQAPFSFEISLAFPLWFTCLRCRDPTLRRMALDLAHRGPPLQGFYKSSEMAAFGNFIMMMEETYGRAMNAANGLPAPPMPNETPCQVQSGRSYDAMTDGQLLSKDKIGFSANPFPITTNFSTELLATTLVPEQARVRPLGMFRAQDGFPPGTAEQEIVKWAQHPNQAFLQFVQPEFDPMSSQWQLAHRYIPIDMTM